MKSALATAAGVAGGMILMDSLKNMMGGNSSAHAGESGGFGSNDQGDGRWADAQQDAAQDQELASNDFEDNNDQGFSDTSSDSWGGGDSGSDT